MFVVTGVSGQVGRAVAENLLAEGLPVRVVVRSAEKGEEWKTRGCEVAVADFYTLKTLTAAFAEAEAVFLLMPPNYDPENGFPQTVEQNKVVRQALLEASPNRLVMLSTVGGHVARENLLNNLKMSEEAIRTLPLPVAILRAAWFFENSAWDLEAASKGEVNGYLQPADHPIPMIAVKDIGAAAASLMIQNWDGLRVVELEAKKRYCQTEITAALADAFGHDVKTNYVPRDEWESLFKSQGAQNPLPRIQMIDGFNEGWIDFEGEPNEQWKGPTSLNEAIRDLVVSRGYK